MRGREKNEERKKASDPRQSTSCVKPQTNINGMWMTVKDWQSIPKE